VTSKSRLWVTHLANLCTNLQRVSGAILSAAVPLIVWVCLHSHLHSELRRKANNVRWYVRWRLFKVIEIDTNRMRFPISLTYVVRKRYACFLSFPRYNDLVVENLRILADLPKPVWYEVLARGWDLGCESWFQNTSPWSTRRWKPHDPAVISFDSMPFQRIRDGRIRRLSLCRARLAWLKRDKNDVRCQKHLLD